MIIKRTRRKTSSFVLFDFRLRQFQVISQVTEATYSPNSLMVKLSDHIKQVATYSRLRNIIKYCSMQTWMLSILAMQDR